MSNELKYPLPRRGKRQQIWDPQSIKALREHLRLTQRQMADELQVRQQTISEWETGVHTPHRSTQKMLTMVAERAGFDYQAGVAHDGGVVETTQIQPDEKKDP